MNILVKKTDFAKFFGNLSERYDIIGPKRTTRGFIIFDNVKDFSELDFSEQTKYSIRKFFLPHKEILFNYKKGNAISPPLDSAKRIFIIHPCDANALLRVDKQYIDEYKDHQYEARRKNSLLFVFRCQTPYKNCFCSDLRTDRTSNYDLLFTDLGGKFIISVGTEKGRELVSQKIFMPIFHEGMTSLQCDRKLPELNNLGRCLGDESWKSESDKCLSCNGCINVCPTCMCFDVDDENSLTPDEGSRVRHWDYCEVKDFTRVAGGYVFRDLRSSRYRHRIMHKFKYFRERHGVNLCVGCGRCIDICPAGLDMIETVERLNKNVQEAKNQEN